MSCIFFGAAIQVISNPPRLYLASSVTPKTPLTVNVGEGGTERENATPTSTPKFFF
jgi:hypothetical protein